MTFLNNVIFFIFGILASIFVSILLAEITFFGFCLKKQSFPL
jgi:hypothetical protein